VPARRAAQRCREDRNGKLCTLLDPPLASLRRPSAIAFLRAGQPCHADPGRCGVNAFADTAACGRAVNPQPLNSELVVAESNHRIDAHSAPRRDVTRRDGHNNQHQRTASKGQWIMRTDAEQLVGHETRQP
jgi:hypothetical protein